jgi:hypothetical protein
MSAKKIKVILLSILTCALSCKDKKSKKTQPTQQNTSFQYQEFRMKNDSDLQKSPIQVKGETMKSDQNQLVEGTDEDGDLVTGEVIIEGTTGLGTLTKKGNNKIEIIVDWSATKNRLIATDEYGYLYQLHFRE